jgi:Na+-translocating ferredoxin:NAD+ oxidoreductase RnfA subunit
MIIVSVFVTIFNLIAQAIIPRIAFNIQAYIDLITTNCIVLAVISEGLTYEFWDAQKKILKACLGYSIALIFLALMREPLGFGTLMNFRNISGKLSCSGIDDNTCRWFLCSGIMEVHAQTTIYQNGCCLSGKFTKRRAYRR